MTLTPTSQPHGKKVAPNTDKEHNFKSTRHSHFTHKSICAEQSIIFISCFENVQFSNHKSSQDFNDIVVSSVAIM